MNNLTKPWGVTNIPFVKHIGIKEQNSELSLDFKEDVLNHINIIHAQIKYKKPAQEKIITYSLSKH